MFDYLMLLLHANIERMKDIDASILRHLDIPYRDGEEPPWE